jgi:hypothetical protein
MANFNVIARNEVTKQSVSRIKKIQIVSANALAMT